MKTVRQEGYEDGYEARQAEVDALTAEVQDKDAELADAKATLDRISKEFEEYKRKHP